MFMLRLRHCCTIHCSSRYGVVSSMKCATVSMGKIFENKCIINCVGELILWCQNQILVVMLMLMAVRICPAVFATAAVMFSINGFGFVMY
jgi:hypothetical protein